MWDSLSKFQKILSIVIALAAVFSLGYKVQAIYARADRLVLVEMRLEQKILSDERFDKQRRIWSLEEQYKRHPEPETKEEIRMLQQEIHDIDQKMKGNGK